MSSYIDKIQKLKIDILFKKDELFKNTRITKRNLDIAFYTTCYYNWTSTDEKVQMEN